MSPGNYTHKAVFVLLNYNKGISKALDLNNPVLNYAVLKSRRLVL